MTSKEVYYKCYYEKKRMPQLESIIANDPYYSYLYARDVIKGRWEGGEKSIATDSECCYRYAIDALKGPFRQGHPEIFNSEYKQIYIKFLKSINYDLNKISEWMI
jgi:hypothetical protein